MIVLIDEFKKPNFESQCIMELKEIKQEPSESVWDFDQMFKVLKYRLTFKFPDEQHQEWFIVELLPNIWSPLTQHNISIQKEYLVIAMKLEASPIGETDTGMAMLQSQLVSLTLHLQEIVKDKGKREKIWCTNCQREDHHKNECPTFAEYMAMGALNTLGPGGGEYCEICKMRGHHPMSCPLLQKYQTNVKSLV
jgi:hypothetical protein